MKLFRFLFLALILPAPSWAGLLDGFEIQQSTPQDLLWALRFQGQSVGELESIGGQPRLSGSSEKRSIQGREIIVLEYEAGSAGTRVITHLDRLLILVRVAEGSFRVALDVPVGLSRQLGEKMLLEERRRLEWGPDSLSLKLGALDEYPETNYVWKNERFVPR
jgi:hypothetical protein